jgi:RNA polymerase sigma-70 factor (ECF subfamily)
MRDSDLVGRIRSGELDFAVVMDDFRQQVRRWLYAMVGPGSDLEELTECVFIRAYSRLGRFDPAKGSFVTWLHTITHNVAVSFLRHRNIAPESLDAMTEEQGPTCAGPAELYEAKMRWERLQQAIGRLEPRKRHAFVGHHLRDLSWEALALEMNCCEHSARNWSAMAAEELRLVL